MAETVSSFNIQLPGEVLTAGDLVGKSIRVTRMHWRGLFKLLLLVCFVNALSVTVIYWLATEYVSAWPFWLVLTAGLLVVLINIVSRLAIGLRTFALQIMLVESIDIGSALDAARKRWADVIIVTLPLVLIDLVMAMLAFATVYLFQRVTVPADPIGFIGIACLAGYLALWMPSTAFAILNGLYTAILIRQKTTVTGAAIRFVKFVLESPGFVFKYVLLGSAVYVLVAVAFNSIFALSPVNLFSGVAKVVAETIFNLVQSVLLSPFGAGWYAAMAVGGCILEKYLVDIQEGSDLNECLTKLSGGSKH